MLPIMDVSRRQGDIDWDKVKASGLVSGVMLRTLGNSAKDKPSKPYIDPTFERNYAECQRLGIPCGVYYYCKVVNTAEADAELALLRKVLTGKTIQLPVAVDIEDAYMAWCTNAIRLIETNSSIIANNIFIVNDKEIN